MTRRLLIILALSSMVGFFLSCVSNGNQKNYPSLQPPGMFNPLTFLSVKGNRIFNENGKETYLRGFHFDCFFRFEKGLYDVIKSTKNDPDRLNVELSRYHFSDFDIKEFKDMGANVVRVGFKMWEIETEPYSYSKKAWKQLDEIITRWGKNGIYVILDLHVAGQNSHAYNRKYGNILWQDNDFRNRVIALWGMIAKRYKDNPYIAGYDIINEPQAPTKKALHSFYQKVIKEIRESDRKHILFIEWNLYQKEKILFGGEYDDSNIVFSIHFYKPGKFTNQGIRGRPVGYKYPGKYGGIYWDKNQINKYFSEVLSKINDRPVFVGEFSAAYWSGGEDAFQWIRDVIAVLNDHRCHYTFFNYKISMRDTFGFYKPRKEIYERIKLLRNDVIRKEVQANDLTDKDKRLFHTKNYEVPQELRRMLKQGLSRKESVPVGK